MTALDAVFAPRGVAVVGASRHPNKLGAVMARSLAGFRDGPVLVNPRAEAGMYPSIRAAVAATGKPVDLAVLCVPAAATADAVADAAAAGARAVLVCSGGFGEVGAAGHQAEQALVDAVRRHDVRLVGPNTSGFMVPRAGLVASFVPAAVELAAGPVAVVAASGGVNHALAFDLVAAGNGISLAIGVGAGIDVTAADVLDYLVADESTSAVALHVESVSDGPALVAAVQRLATVKPVVALIVGRSDVAAFAQSHTGALATSWRTTRAVLRQAGAVVVDDERELVDAITALCRTRLAPAVNPGVGVITAQAGPGLLLVDALRSARVSVPILANHTRQTLADLLPPITFQDNPVDTGRPSASFPDVVATVAADPGVDLIAAYALLEPDTLDLAGTFADVEYPAVVASGGPADQLADARAHLHKVGTALFGSPTAAATAVRALISDARTRVARDTCAVTAQRLPLPLGQVDEATAKDLLGQLGIATPARRVCADAGEAHAALTDLGAPVVVKILDASVLHKSEVGGVHVDIRSPAQLDTALAAIGPHAYLVEAMAEPGVELVVGARRDPVFGPVVLLGIGGTAAEALADVAVRAAPLSVEEAASMADELAGRALLRGFRGGPVVDERRLGELIANVGAALAATPEIAEIEINPLRATSDALIALDAVILRTEAGGSDDR